MKDKSNRWPGGHVHRQKDGRPLYVIARSVNGRRFHISTRCHNLTAAMKQLERFEADPLSYAPVGDERAERMPLTDELVLEFHGWSVSVKGNTRKHANEMCHRLADWKDDFRGADLRHITLRDHIKPALERRATNRQHRIIAIKSFYAWLRKERCVLTSAQDPTLDLSVPSGSPEKYRRKKALDADRVRAAFGKLVGPERDCLVLLAATGWHVTELERFIRDGEMIPSGLGPLGPLFGFAVLHKSGDNTGSPIHHPETIQAAERLRAAGMVPRRLNKTIKAACVAAGVEPFTLGVIRHTVATWAIEDGSTPAEVAEFLNHKDKSTTERFYIDVGVPTVSVPVLRLLGG